jgi:succinylarginine dihydrolase
MTSHEWQFDGLVGPSHSYAGLAPGNLASVSNAGSLANPRKAALQGLAKMRFVQGLGVKQAFLPPHPRPVMKALRHLGFAGNDARVIDETFRQAPELLAAVYSSAFMWVANAATVTASTDAADGKLHLTPANLTSHFHRALEPEFTTRLLRRIFANAAHFTVHDPLPATTRFSDEGAANHMRIATQHGAEGVNIYVYGTAANATVRPQKFIARQQREACEAIARQHGVNRAVYLQQHPQAIDRGVFHNDVIAMNTTRLMLAQEHAFAGGIDAAMIAAALAQPTPAGGRGESGAACAVDPLSRSRERARVRGEAVRGDFQYIEITDKMLTVEEAVATYFFNSQLLELADGNFALIAPQECAEHPRARALLESLATHHAPPSYAIPLRQGFAGQEASEGRRITHHFLDVRESMRNGGGPACLRLRVVMNEAESAAMHPGIILTDDRHAALQQWVQQFYRDRLTFDDLRDPKFPGEIAAALAALEAVIGMKGLYSEPLSML